MYALSLAATTLLALVGAASASPVAPRQSASTFSRAFLTNCWANPGARSEIEFFTTYPTNFGNATPDTISVVSENVNEIWESGGSADVNGETFTWTIDSDAQEQPAGAEVGSASLSSGNQYTLVKESEQILYTEDGFDCRVIYGAIQTNQ